MSGRLTMEEIARLAGVKWKRWGWRKETQANSKPFR